ncbi:hypothetical protein [Bradyrhizobium genosp. SA-3]|uniref:hypothetical protein n=1 Tax=Bradyrhizobium genosp. SA-3 TaxID=508868 RepID=UPI0026821926
MARVRSQGAVFTVDEQQKIEHQIELATRGAALANDETTVTRFRSFAEELTQKLLRMMRRGKVRARAYELWEQAAVRPTATWTFGSKRKGRSKKNANRGRAWDRHSDVRRRR